MTDAYDNLVKKSVIKENYADKTHNDLNDKYMIPCSEIDMFYNDSLFYLHFHFSLYAELLKYNITNNFNITTFTTLWNALKIKIDSAVSSSSVSTSFLPKFTLTSYNITNGGSGYSDSAKLIFTPTNGSSQNVGTVNIQTGFKSSIINSNFNTNNSTGFRIGDIITFNTSASGTSAIGTVKTVDALGKITEIEFIHANRGSGYTSGTAPTVLSYTKGVGNTINEITTSCGLIFRYDVITNYIHTISITNTALNYNSTGTFSITAPSTGEIQATGTPSLNIKSMGFIDTANNIFNFNSTNFQFYYNSTLPYYSGDNIALVSDKIPRIDNISTLTPIDILLIDGSTDDASNYYSITTLTEDYNLSGTTYYPSTGDHSYRKLKFNKTLKKIFEQDATEILGYLAYQVRYYNIIVLNTSIQRTIYENYLKNNTLIMSIGNLFKSGGTGLSNLTNIITHIRHMKTNLINIENDIKKTNNIYSDTTKNYPAKIAILNENKENYNKIQNSLNIVIKDYNQHYDNYNRLKKYASIIIVFLVILIIASIAVTILPFFNANAKNTYYILMLILIIILTILFYNNFSHINLYEKFAVNCGNSNTYKTTYSDATSNNVNRENNYDVFNKIAEEIEKYNKESDAVNYQMSSGIYTTDNTILTKDADNYINDVYLTKMKKINIYKTKHTELKNLIETMKQQIIYLYNIIIIICIFIIILLIALIFYVNMPFATNYIIALVSIAIFILVIYYIYAIVKPTRLIANKNYWGIY